MARFLFMSLFRYVVVFVVIYSVIQYYLRNKGYTVSPKSFRTTVEKSATSTVVGTVQKMQNDLRSQYGAHMLLDTETSFLSLQVGGVQVKWLLLFGSLTEHISVFGTPFRTEGKFGLHWMNQTCTVISGTFTKVSDAEKIVDRTESFGTGENFRLNEFDPALVRFDDDSYVACYGRGFVPWTLVHSSLQTGLASGDALSGAKLMLTYGQALIRELALWITESLEYGKTLVGYGGK